MVYTLRPGSDTVVIDATNQVIGPESGALWADYQAWLVAGNTPNPVPGPSLASLQAALAAAASAASAAIIGQVTPDPVHQLAYLNAFAMLGGGSTPPSIDPPKSAFNAIAAANGMTPSAFAAVVCEFGSASLNLSIAVVTLQAASAAAANASQLATALSAFEASLSSIVAALNATSPPATITLPPAISIAGINA